MRRALSLVLTGVIAVALGVFGSVALASTLKGTSSSDAAAEIQKEIDGGGSSVNEAPAGYGTR